MFRSVIGFLDNNLNARNCVSRVFSSISAFTQSQKIIICILSNTYEFLF